MADDSCLLIRRGTFPATRKSGVTILEILIVLTIIAMIAAVAGPRLIGYLGRAKTQTAELQIDQLKTAVQLFYIDTGRYPTTAEGLSVLMTAPAGMADWSGPYLSDAAALQDPWGRDYLYAEPSETEGVVVRSLGRDGNSGGTGEDRDLGS